MSNIEQTQSLDQQLTNNYADLIQWVKDGANQAGSFLNEQTPLFIQEYLNWIFWSNLMGVVFFSILFLFAIWSLKKLINVWKGLDDFDDFLPPTIIGVIMSSGIILSSAVFIACSSMDMVKVKVAPRVVIVEKIGSLIK